MIISYIINLSSWIKICQKIQNSNRFKFFFYTGSYFMNQYWVLKITLVFPVRFQCDTENISVFSVSVCVLYRNRRSSFYFGSIL